MPASNFSFLLYVVSAEDQAVVKHHLERALGCSLGVADTQGMDTGALADYEGECFGLLVSLQWVHAEPHGNVFRISGGTRSRVWADDGEIVSLDEYASRLLRAGGLEHVMTRQDYVAYRQ